MFARIASLTHERGYCYASNAYLADAAGVSERTVRMWISKLVKQKHVIREIDQQQGNVRHIRLVASLPHLRKQASGPTEADFRTPPEADCHIDKKGRDKKVDREARPQNLPEVKEYAKEISLPAVEAEKFYDHFEANGWRQGGRSAMKDWRAALRNWKRRCGDFSPNGKQEARPEAVPLKEQPAWADPDVVVRAS